ncbi:unnamed protein product [Adineta ricciae]|uniref:DDE-1 domain-containing protein n=1 Tax=Adineta ricciae TaxID=249248 RepID=A0A815VCN9_ADIRI|nr:unnamed protein product [Adineta ricciae]
MQWGKQSKERYTVLLCANWSGTHKLKPLVIGNSRRPRYFKNIGINKLPVIWKANRTSWMNSTIFTDWIQMINIQMRRENRKILLVLDNAPVHPADLKLSNVTLIFFPPNTTSKIQPLDQGVIRCFKAYYRSRLVKHIIKRCTVALTPDQIIITALDAINWIDQAWADVTGLTIRNTFCKAGFQHRQTVTMINNDMDEINELTFNSSLPSEEDSLKKLDILLSYVKMDELQLTAMEFVKIDEDIPVFNEVDDITVHSLTIEMNDIQQDQDDEIIQEEPPSLTEALEMTRKLHLLACTSQPELHEVVANLESKLIDIYIDSKGNKQTSITDFFRKT